MDPFPADQSSPPEGSIILNSPGNCGGGLGGGGGSCSDSICLPVASPDSPVMKLYITESSKMKTMAGMFKGLNSVYL